MFFFLESFISLEGHISQKLTKLLNYLPTQGTGKKLDFRYKGQADQNV